MALSITIPDGYGYPVLVALGAIPLLAAVQGSIVTTLRGAAKTPYPNAYASSEQIKNDPAAYKFNCAQRAHSNLMENLPQTILSILFAGLGYPQTAALLGAGWVLSRSLYVYGYISSSKPQGKGRALGGMFWFMQGGLWFLCCLMGTKMI